MNLLQNLVQMSSRNPVAKGVREMAGLPKEIVKGLYRNTSMGQEGQRNYNNQHQYQPPQAPQLMEVGPGGVNRPSNQGNLPPEQQRDTYMSNDYSGRGPQQVSAVQRPRLQVQPMYRQSQQMQPFGMSQEDDYTPSAALENTGYYNPQTTQHGQYMQQGGYNPQTSMHGGLQQGNDPMAELRRLLGY